MKLVEGLKYYQDTPDKESEKEAIAIDRSGDEYYRPFFNNPKKILYKIIQATRKNAKSKKKAHTLVYYSEEHSFS